MRTTAGALIVAALVFGSGCARSDWIERTLVTVDVTGTWNGRVGLGTGTGGPVSGGTLWLELAQQGSKVEGRMQYLGSAHPDLPSTPQPIDGTVAGDVFTFKQRSGTVEGELTVSGDEMTGEVWISTRRPIFLRRVEPSSRPPR